MNQASPGPADRTKTRAARCRALLVCAGIAAAGAGAAWADEPPRIEKLEVGFGGLYKVGYFAPVRVTLTAGSRDFRGRMELLATDTDGAPTTFVEPDATVEVGAGQTLAVWRYVKPGRTTGPISVRLIDEQGRTVATRRTPPFQNPLRSTRRLVLVVGRSVGMDDIGRLQLGGEEKLIAVSEIADAGSFPDRWYAYEGVDALVIATSEPGAIEQMDDTQAAALVKWVAVGGQVVVSAGRRAADVFAPGHRLHAFRPGEFTGMKSAWSRTGLEQYSKAAQALPPGPSGEMAMFDELLGDVECYEAAGATDERALIVRRPYGLGQVRVIGVDVDREPLASWKGRPRLYSRMTDIPLDEPRDSGGGRVAHVGYKDLVGQLRGSLDRFDGVTIIRFSWVAGLVVVYLLLIGPAEYLGLRRIRRSHWTWVTFPTIVVLFCGLAYGIASRSKGHQLLMNQVDLVDVDISESIVRGTTWVNIYSPRGELLDLALQVHSGAGDGGRSDSLLTWQGLPGRSLGGMDTTASDMGEARPYVILAGGRNGIRGLPLHDASSKGLLARWWDSVPMTVPNITADGLGLLHGEFINPLTVELSQAVILHDKWLFTISGTVAPGAAIRLDDLSPRDLNWQLSKRSLHGTHEVTKAWDETNVADLDRILEIMMFHEAAGGRTYTRLDHHFHRDMDLSGHLRSGRAILVGRASRPATELYRGDRSLEPHVNQRWTYYRVVFPVTRTGEIPDVEEPRGRI